ncbi:MAG TPA: cation:proton antiporter [Candidatus Binatia bacterium]|nr:cation:proton antiporter [Candidatus Binatia bacterium]
MEHGVFAEIGLLIAIATLVSLVMRFLRQPLIVGHILTGFLVGQFALGLFQNTETLELFSQLGISFLLFTVGLTLNPKVFKEYGWISIVTGFGQVLLTGSLGVIVCMALGFNWITSLYVGVALSFSSTVIVMKLLSDKGDLDKLYVKLSIGSLLLQDLIAIVLLFAIPFVTGSQGNGSDLLQMLIVGTAAGLGVFLFSHYVVRYLHRFLTQSQELIFLFTVAWGIGISSLFALIGFSLEGGALIAGVALSTIPSRHEMSARLAPLRDFFIVVFFILLGTRMVVSEFNSILWPAIFLSLFVLLINPLLQLIVMGAMGYRRKTSFQTGMMAAQISEFSLILVALGVSLGQVVPSVLSMVTLVGLVTIFISSYLILYSDRIYPYFAPFLKIFEQDNVRERSPRTKSYSVLLIGSNRIGFDFMRLFKDMKKKFLVIDHDPEVIGLLSNDKIPHEYGDASDPDLLDELKINSAELVVSTVPDLETNLVILSCAKREGKGPIVMVVAHRINNALELYQAGADYVILPHFLGGSYAASLVRKFTKDAAELQDLRNEHISALQERASHGHDHPQLDRLR